MKQCRLFRWGWILSSIAILVSSGGMWCRLWGDPLCELRWRLGWPELEGTVVAYESQEIGRDFRVVWVVAVHDTCLVEKFLDQFSLARGKGPAMGDGRNREIVIYQLPQSYKDVQVWIYWDRGKRFLRVELVTASMQVSGAGIQ